MSQPASPYDDAALIRVDDFQVMQETVLAAAIDGDLEARSQLASLRSAFEEPYRTVAERIQEYLSAGKFLDRRTAAAVLAECRLMRRGATGLTEHVAAEQVLSLMLSHHPEPGQAAAYIEQLQRHSREKKQAEFAAQVQELFRSFAQEPEKLQAEIERLATDARRDQFAAGDDAPEELLEVIPYVERLVQRQQGHEFLGLDSGFPHLNNLLNGLDMGLSVLAAPPGKGKTTLAVQLAGQVALRNSTPVVFVSMEQSKEELRAKTLARLSKLEYRHILRGRLYADDAASRGKLLEAATRYAEIGRWLTIIEGDPSTTTGRIIELAQRKMAKMGAERCLVIVDYLQILPTAVDDAHRFTSTKDRIDFLVSDLRRVVRKLNSPVWAISSENRAGYDKSKSLDVFKETGGIEYSADVAMLLVDGDPPSGSSEADYRPMNLNIVKNRNGERGVIKLKFYAKRAEFVETGREDLPEDSGG